MYTYCFFCETQRCRTIAKQIEQSMGLTCIAPKIIQRKWVKGQAFDEYHDWLPGYIFLYSDHEIIMAPHIDGIIRMLGSGALSGTDHAFAMGILKANGVMGNIKVLEQGDRCVIQDPLWEGVIGRIVKLDRNRKRCCVEYSFDEVTRQVWVGYEMLAAADENP